MFALQPAPVVVHRLRPLSRAQPERVDMALPFGFAGDAGFHGHLWHLRVIDVDGDRVVIQSMEYAGTPSQRRTELEAMGDSIQIEP